MNEYQQKLYNRCLASEEECKRRFAAGLRPPANIALAVEEFLSNWREWVIEDDPSWEATFS